MTAVRGAAICAIALMLGGAFAEVDVNPTCSSPQIVAPAVPLQTTYAVMAWNGREYGVLLGSATIKFQRIFADGTAAASPVTVATSTSATPLAIVWNGSSYGALYRGYVMSGIMAMYFLRLDENGSVLSGPTRVNYYGETPPVTTSGGALAAGASTFLVTWSDARGTTGNDVYSTVLESDGDVRYHDLVTIAATGAQSNPSAAWSRLCDCYVVVAMDYRSGTRYEISESIVYPGSGTTSSRGVISSGAGGSYYPSVASGSAGVVATWYDSRDGGFEIYAGSFDGGGSHYGSDVRLTSDAADSRYPLIQWTGAEYEVAFLDDRSGVSDVYFQRVAADGSGTLGSAVRLTYGSGIDSSGQHALAFGSRGALLWYGRNGSWSFMLPVGCSTPYEPGCPDALDAYGISGTSATLDWLPAWDQYTDIAYYQVYRNGGLVGSTSKTSWNDTGLTPGTTYAYSVRTVNAGGVVSTPCPDADLFVKSSASLTLAVTRSGNDVDLAWNALPQTTYRVMRGTSPQEMTLLTSTSATTAVDRNAAVGTVCYFYSIDEPPQPAP